MKGKREELRIPMKFDEVVSDLLKVKPPPKPPKPPERKSKKNEKAPRG